ncbi:uncharacterized protein LOC110453516 isoform X3 [Mizuhopecten yessoensis]|uniref:uncharacterized protein LOC110453516 isoform X3 n=1 Tax=Mizuhopecten yessoensis TaxID=6573 RepID=UPI000B458D3B|nr:uncharacterized protein LOC110453516 isoform X3 [Mizuhopecten yessoensis]
MFERVLTDLNRGMNRLPSPTDVTLGHESRDRECTQCYLITTESFLLLMVLVLCVYRKSQGAEFSKGDIIFIAVVIGACVVAIIITIVCHLACRRRSNKGNQASLLGICCCYDNNVNSRFKVVSQKMGSDCAICLEEKNMMIKPVVEITCKHTYHQACISKCLEMDKRAKCPQCRRHPGQFSTTERFVAIIQTLLRKRKERTLEATAAKCRSPEEEEKMSPEFTDFPECSGYTPPAIPPEAVV